MKSETIKKIKLELEKDEAKWLMDVMQNPLHDQTLIEESQEDKEYRIKFFETLKMFLT